MGLLWAMKGINVANDNRVLQSAHGTFFSSLSPRYAGMARGLVLAIGMAVLEAVIVFLSGMDTSELPAWLGAVIPVIVFGLRSFEGQIDHRAVKGNDAA